jgi:uncharacterized membrane protein YgdD (TMEM256/DUF423 family)
MISADRAQRIAATLGLLGVVLGAFGAHSLQPRLLALGTAAIWEKAVFYHFIHAGMMYLVAVQRPFRPWPWCAWAVGVVIFSGSLYALAVTGLRWLGAITPIGGVAFIVGWGALAFRRNPSE